MRAQRDEYVHISSTILLESQSTKQGAMASILFFFALGFSCVSLSRSLSLRTRGSGGVVWESTTISKGLQNSSAIVLEVVNRTSLATIRSGECVCPLGKFWHWNAHRCVDQGGWGYECGFFPAEHHQMVCKDGFKCQKIKSNTVYTPHSKNTVDSFPATCVDCTAEDRGSNCVVMFPRSCGRRHDE